MERPVLSEDTFKAQFDHFRELIRRHSGEPFQSFHRGLPFDWESYKLPLRARALELMNIPGWSESSVGSGQVLDAVIRAIELNESGLTNNLVAWQNRYGHESRSHRRLLDARANEAERERLERLLVGFYSGELPEPNAFEQLRSLAGKRYDLLAYLFFLRDADRFMPIRVATFDKAFARLGVDLTTSQRCSWDNYSLYNAALAEVQKRIADVLGSEVRLVDAHSFCWMLVRLDEKKPSGTTKGNSSADGLAGQDPREHSIRAMVQSVKETVQQSDGPPVEETPKHKELRMTDTELADCIRELLEEQQAMCALTGLPVHWHEDGADPELLASLDRIDSDGHYERGNLQVVCRFANFWKGAYDDAEFRRLLALVRGDDIRHKGFG